MNNDVIRGIMNTYGVKYTTISLTVKRNKIYLNFRFTFSAAYYLPLILEKLIHQLIIIILNCKQVGSAQLMIDGDSYQIYFPNILSRFILV